MKGIEPSCAAWEAAVLPLNYTRDAIFDFRLTIYDLQAAKNRSLHSGCAFSIDRRRRTGAASVPQHSHAGMKKFPRTTVALFSAILATSASAARHTEGPLTPFRNTTKQGAYTIDTVGDTLGQALPQNTRLIIRIFGTDNKVVKPGQIALVDKSGAVIKPVFREDRKVGHEENTGLPLSVSPQASTSGYSGTGVGINLNKIFGPHGSYSYTKVDWPKSTFTADKRLQIALPNGQTFLLSLTSLAK